MVRSSNLVMLRGRLGADPEIKTFGPQDDPRKVANFRLATNSWFRDKDGHKVERTEWHRVEAWSRLAEYVATHLRKGDRVQIVGNLKVDQVDGPSGTRRVFTTVRAHEIENFTPRNGSPDRMRDRAPDQPMDEVPAEFVSAGRPESRFNAKPDQLLEEELPF